MRLKNKIHVLYDIDEIYSIFSLIFTFYVEVIEGQGKVHLIEHLETDQSNQPMQKVKIAKAGSRKVHSTYTISDDPYK